MNATLESPILRISVALTDGPLTAAIAANPRWTTQAEGPLPVRAVVSDEPSALARARAAMPTVPRVLVVERGAIATKGVRLAHYLLPSDATALELTMVLDRIAGRTQVTGLTALIDHKTRLPSMPRNIARLLEVLDHPQVTMPQVVEALEADPALAARTLQLANAPCFWVKCRVGSLQRAVTLLGISTIRATALAGEAFASIEGVDDSQVARIRDRGLIAVQVVRHISGMHSGTALTAALLMDIGQLLLLQQDPTYPALQSDALSQGRPLVELEQGRFGMTHAQLGAHLLNTWRLPDDVVQAIAFSHTPYPHPSSAMDVRAVVYIASSLLDLAEGGEGLDQSWVEMMGLAQKVPEWTEFVSDLSMFENT